MSDRVRVFIPFRDRGDAILRANLDLVMAWWYTHDFEPTLVSDGLDDAERFNRFRAMNRAVEQFPETEVFVFCDADTIIEPGAVRQALFNAEEEHMVVVPFWDRGNLSAESTEYLREQYHDESSESLSEWWQLPGSDPRSIFQMTFESRLEHGEDVGSAYVVSRQVLAALGGFPETVTGYTYAHRVFWEGAATVLSDLGAGFITSQAVRLWHPAKWVGEHRTDEDREADARDRATLVELRADSLLHGCGPVHELFSRRIPANR